MNIPLKDRTFTGLRTARDRAEALGEPVREVEFHDGAGFFFCHPSLEAYSRADMLRRAGYTVQTITDEKDGTRTIRFLRPGEDPAAPSADNFPEWPKSEARA